MRKHKASGQAYVLINGKQNYLGQWGSAEARRAFRDLINTWESAQKHVSAPLPSGRITLAELAAAFLNWAKGRYRRKDGVATSELTGCRGVVDEVLSQFPGRFADDFTGRNLRDAIAAWTAKGLVRTTVNTYLRRVKRMFRWGAKNELIEETTAAKIALVDGLRFGEAPDNDEIQPVPLRDLVKTLHGLKPNFVAIARLQFYCGARPGEVCRMRGDEIKRGSIRIGGQTIRVPDGLAVFMPGQHKTAGKGQTVFYTLGPRAQAEITPFLEGDGFVFRGHTAPHVRYSTYRLNVLLAAERAGVPAWTPNRLRHNFLTRWDALAGIEAAAAAVRHKKISTTAIYVQRDLRKVGELAAKFG